MTLVVAHVPRRFSATAWGGTETLIAESAARSRAAGCAPRVLTSMAMDPRPTDEIAGVPVERFPYRYLEWPLPAARRAAYDRKGGNLVSPRLTARLGRLPELGLVHLHTGNRLGAWCLRVARRRRVPCVLTLHGGHFAIPPAERAALSGDGARGVDWGKPLGLLLGARSLLRRLDAVICVGKEEYDAARRALPGQRVALIPGGVDLERFAAGQGAAMRQRLGVRSGQRVILCTARLDEQKDQLTLVEAWRALADPGIDLVLAGAETTPGYAARLQMAADGALGRLILTGNIAPTEMPDLFAAADLVALPSRHEPFGLAVIEAWAARRPVVAAAVGGPAWLLSRGGGLLAPPGAVGAWREALTSLLDVHGPAARLAAEGRALAEAGHGWDVHMRRTMDLYRAVGAVLPT